MMQGKAIAIFLLIFFAVAYGMSMINPYLPNTGNVSINYFETGGLSVLAIFFIWEKWGRKESGQSARV